MKRNTSNGGFEHRGDFFVLWQLYGTRSFFHWGADLEPQYPCKGSASKHSTTSRIGTETLLQRACLESILTITARTIVEGVGNTNTYLANYPGKSILFVRLVFFTACRFVCVESQAHPSKCETAKGSMPAGGLSVVRPLFKHPYFDLNLGFRPTYVLWYSIFLEDSMLRVFEIHVSNIVWICIHVWPFTWQWLLISKRPRLSSLQNAHISNIISAWGACSYF